MLPRSQGRQMRTATPHRAHVNTRASAAATAPAPRGLYKSRRARDPVPGYPAHRATAAGDTRRPGMPPGPPPSEPLLLCLPHLPAPRQSAPRHLRWVTSDEHTPGVSRERLRHSRESRFVQRDFFTHRGIARRRPSCPAARRAKKPSSLCRGDGDHGRGDRRRMSRRSAEAQVRVARSRCGPAPAAPTDGSP